MPKKLLCFCDSPTTPTGFGRVANEILSRVHDNFDVEITIWGINHGGLGHEKFNIINPRGETNEEYDFMAIDQFCEKIRKEDFDMFWSVQDSFNMPKIIQALSRKRMGGHKFLSSLYFPVDVPMIPAQWCKNVMNFDYPVVYTHFGKEQVLYRLGRLPEVENMKIAYHGTNTIDFYPMDAEEKNQFRYEEHLLLGNQFMFMNLNKNQVRKDIPTTMIAFRIFMRWWKKQGYKTPPPKLLLHMHPNDASGENLALIRDQWMPDMVDHIMFPIIPDNGFPTSYINRYYNACDCLVSSSLGEGWGLSTTEAMAAKTPVIVPHNTANLEIIGNLVGKNGDAERGKYAESGADEDYWKAMDRCSHYGDPLRPVTSAKSLAYQMTRTFLDCTDEKGNRLQTGAKDGSETRRQIEAAYLWAHELTWDKVFKEVWDDIFALALERR